MKEKEKRPTLSTSVVRVFFSLVTVHFYLLSVDCFHWPSILFSSDCVKDSLMLNHWMTAEELSDMDEGSMSVLLKAKLNFFFDGDFHTQLDLGFRQVLSSRGSLCGMAALYKAAADTVLTVFEIKSKTYDDLKETLLTTMGHDLDANRLTSDETLLENYYTSKILISFS